MTDEQDWCIPIMRKIAQPSSTMVTRDLKDFTIVNDELYYRGNSGVIARAFSTVEAKEKLPSLHAEIMTSASTDTCKDKDTIGLKWPRKQLSYNLPDARSLWI